MATTTDKLSRIAEIDALLARGAAEVETDGQRVKYDLAQLREERKELTQQVYPNRKRRFSSFDLSQ